MFPAMYIATLQPKKKKKRRKEISDWALTLDIVNFDIRLFMYDSKTLNHNII